MFHFRYISLIVLAFALSGVTTAQRAAGERRAQMKERMQDERAAVRELLDHQVEAWNRGDLEGYMEGYWRSEQLTFFSGGTVTRGWDATIARYRKRYQSAGKASMGKLDFSDLEVQRLGPQSAMARGHWHLVMAAAESKEKNEPRGLFTLILRRMPEGWRIIHDHTSVE